MNKALSRLGRALVDMAAAAAHTARLIADAMRALRPTARTIARALRTFTELFEAMERQRRARRPVAGPERSRAPLRTRTAARRRADRTRIERWLSSRGRFGHK